MRANFGDPSAPDHELKHKKNNDFWFKNLFIPYNSKTTRHAKLKLKHNVGAYKCFMQT